MIKFSIIVCILALLGYAQAQGEDPPKCGVCQAGNDALCLTETTYYNCWDGEKIGNEMDCPRGTVCSTANSICVEPTTGSESVCDGNNVAGSCGVCASGKKYTCVSRREAGRCINERITVTMKCKEDEICVANLEDPKLSVCVPECVADYLKVNATCNDDTPYTTTTTTTEAPITPGPDARLVICKAAADGHTTNFFYVYPDQSNCNDAVYCQRSSQTSTDWKTIYRSCPSGTPYFDLDIRDCVKNKPTSCQSATA